MGRNIQKCLPLLFSKKLIHVPAVELFVLAMEYDRFCPAYINLLNASFKLFNLLNLPENDLVKKKWIILSTPAVMLRIMLIRVVTLTYWVCHLKKPQKKRVVTRLVIGFFVRFGYVLHIGYKFVHKEFQGSN